MHGPVILYFHCDPDLVQNQSGGTFQRIETLREEMLTMPKGDIQGDPSARRIHFVDSDVQLHPWAEMALQRNYQMNVIKN